MSQTLLIAYDRNTVELEGQYNCIYDELSTLEELVLEWLHYSPGSYHGPWRIGILDRELFPKFKKDFFKLSTYAPQLKSFEDVCTIVYIKDVNNVLAVNYPNEMEMYRFEYLMGADDWVWRKKK